MTARQETPYTVVGNWPFPQDMLRRDNARPASEEDARKIERLSGETKPDDDDGPVSIDLIAGEGFRPLTERWESFRWSIPGDVDHALIKQAREATRRREALKQAAYAKLTPEEIEAVEESLGARAYH